MDDVWADEKVGGDNDDEDDANGDRCTNGDSPVLPVFFARSSRATISSSLTARMDTY